MELTEEEYNLFKYSFFELSSIIKYKYPDMVPLFLKITEYFLNKELEITHYQNLIKQNLF